MVPFVGSYFEILKAVVEDIKTEYFWFFANFVDIKHFDLLISFQNSMNEIRYMFGTPHTPGRTEQRRQCDVDTYTKFKKQMHT